MQSSSSYQLSIFNRMISPLHYICRLMTRFMSNQRKYTLDSVLSQLSCPLLLVWGDLDPWVGPAKALRIKEFYPDTSVVNLQAGHCPHDEVPELVNKALLDWLSTLTCAPNSLQPLWTWLERFLPLSYYLNPGFAITKYFYIGKKNMTYLVIQFCQWWKWWMVVVS